MSTIKVDRHANLEPANLDLSQALTADTTPNDIESAIAHQNCLIFLVANFMDGRIFSLIRHTRHLGFQGEIIVGGEFALDQANYFVKSGATAFLVDETNVETLIKTLQDLATGYDGKAVSHLPLFS